MTAGFLALSPASRRRVLTLLAMNLVNGSTAGVLGIALPLYTLALHGTARDVGLTAAVQWVAVLGLSLPVAALLGDRLRWSTLFAAGAVLQAASLLALPLVHAASLVPVVALVNGAGRTIGHIPVGATLLDELAQLGPEYAGWHRASFSVGLVLVGPVLGGIALPSLGAPALFRLAASAILIAGIVVGLVGERQRRATAVPLAPLFLAQVVTLRRLATRATVVRAFSVEGLVNAAVTVFGAFAPLLVTTVLHAPPVWAGALVAAEGSAYVVTLTFGGPLLAGLGSRGQYLAGAAVVVAGAIAAAWSPGLPAAFPAVVLLGAGLGVISFATFAVLGAQPEDKGAVFSLFGMCMAAFVMAGPALAGFVGDLLGVRAVFLAIAPVFAIAGAVLALTVRPGEDPVRGLSDEVDPVALPSLAENEA